MKLEASLKYFSPQGMYIGDDVKGTSPERLTGTDVMAAIGTTSNRERFGWRPSSGRPVSARLMSRWQSVRWRVTRWKLHRRMCVKQLVVNLAGVCWYWLSLLLLSIPDRRPPA